MWRAIPAATAPAIRAILPAYPPLWLLAQESRMVSPELNTDHGDASLPTRYSAPVRRSVNGPSTP